MSAARRAHLAVRRITEPEHLVLAAIFVAFSAFYVWQVSRRVSPTLFTDELELTQISRAIADVGHPARRGVSYGFTTIVPWLTAPFWWIDSVSRAYGAIKGFQAIAMAASIFPAYGIARFVLDRRFAVVAAAASIAVPALSYSSILVEEPFAYPIATLALFLTLRAAERRTAGSFALAAAGAILAMATRSQLSVMLLVVAIAAVVSAWGSERVTRWRRSWTAWDRLGTVVVAIGIVIVLNSLASRASAEWRDTTQLWKGRIWDYGIWAGGAWAIGVGVVPAVALLAVLGRRSPGRDGRARAFTIVAAAATGSLLWYAALKGAYLSTVFSSLVVERNLIYLSPLAMTAMLVILVHRDVRWWAFAPAGALVGYAITTVPTELESFPYYEAHGLAILALANRLLAWPAGKVHTTLVILACVVPVLLVVIVSLRRRPRLAGGLAAATLAAVVTWSMTAEIYAADGERDAADIILHNYGKPADWVDRATGRGSVTILGQQLNSDPTGLWLTEFWNRGIEHVWSVEGSAPGPGPTLTPDLASPDGTLGSRAGTDWALPLNGVELQGPRSAATGRGGSLVRLTDGVLKLVASRTGIYPDGWTGATAAFNQFDVTAPGTLTLSLSRRCVPTAAEVTIVLGPIAVGKDHQASIGRRTASERLRTGGCDPATVTLPTPAVPWRLELTSETFVPGASDPRPLGVVAAVSSFTPDH